MDRIKLLCDISELNHLFRDSVSIEDFLARIVVMVTEHMKVDVCSIYLYDEDTDMLVLKATEGLHEDAIDHVQMKLGAGLTGRSLKELRTICVSKASKEKDYKLFVGTGEEDFDNFLAVPITRGISRIGVLVVQRRKRRKFNESDELACKAVASQLANIVENAKFLMSIHQPHEEKVNTEISSDLSFIKGKVASEGFAFSESIVLDNDKTFASLLKRQFEKKYSLEEFDKAISATEDQLERLQNAVEEKLSDAASLIFSSHLLILKDKEFIGQMRTLIEGGENPPIAMLRVTKQYMDIFATSANTYVREKVQDVEDLILRVAGNLLGENEILCNCSKKVVISRELFPSDILRMSSENVAGIVLVSGGVTSHLSILARSLEIPMVIANLLALLTVPRKTPVLVDAESGNVYVNPSEDVLEGFKQRDQSRRELELHRPMIEPETFTSDGEKIRLMANINLLSDLKHAKEMKCEGVGLYRTEFPFIIRSDFPSEQEQFVTYKKLVDQMESKPVVFRTLDIGGDKVLSYFHNAKEQNPGMGMRSIRFSLQNKPIFAKQIRAILSAGTKADIRIMFPMISSIEEFLEAKQVVLDCSADLTREGIKHNNNPQMGMMVELPCVVELIDEFAQIVDFFSIGTNDFVQFMLGVDRTNENVASFYLPHHPAVLRAIAKVVAGAAKCGKDVSVCGDMAHDDRYVKFLIGAGVKTLSLEGHYMPRIQQAISKVDLEEAKAFTKELLAEASIEEIDKKLKASRG